MLKLKYQMGNAKINIYGDRPNEYLDQLSSVGIRYFIISETDIHPEIFPHFVLSQDKLKGFGNLVDFSKQYKIPLIHIEDEDIPLLPNNQKRALLEAKAHINIFTTKELASSWGSDSNYVIPYSHNGLNLEYKEGIIFSESIPVKEILGGALPVIKRNKSNLSVFTEFKNCLMFSSEDEKKYVYAKISNMDKNDLLGIQASAVELIKEKFPFDSFEQSWKDLIMGVLR
jgi:hypothetical protein